MCVASDTIWYSEVGISFAAGTREHLPEPSLRIQDSTIRFGMSIARKLSAVTVSTNSGPTEATLSWAHRDRLAQTSSVFDDYTSPDIGPEPGVAYEVRIHWVDVDTEETLEPAAAVIDVGHATSIALTDADYPQPPIGVEKAAIRVRAVRAGYEDRAFREYRVLMGGKVQITDQELTILFTGPGVDVTAQDLILPFTGPGVDLMHQDLILSFDPPEMGVIAQELVVEMNP